MITATKTKTAEVTENEPETPKILTPKTTTDPLKFSKAQFIKTCPENRDLLNALLDNETKYTKNEVKTIVSDFKKRKL